MENNAGTVETTQRAATLPEQLSEEELARQTNNYLSLFSSIIDCPKDQLILRNAITTLLLISDHKFSVKGVYALLTQEQTRTQAAKELSDGIPSYWSKEWDSLWKKDADPLLSVDQQRVTTRTRLANFWSKEWSDMPLEIVAQLTTALKNSE